MKVKLKEFFFSFQRAFYKEMLLFITIDISPLTSRLFCKQSISMNTLNHSPAKERNCCFGNLVVIKVI